jgi:formiminoglutamase
MDLKLFFDPIDESIIDPALSPSAFQNIAYLHKEKKLDLKGMRVALIGLSEGRGHLIEQDLSEVPSRIRKSLYPLTIGLNHDGIVDLGDLRKGPSFEETNLRLKEVCEYLISQEILPIILGGLQNMTIGQYLSYESTGKLLTLLNVDAKLDLEESENQTDSYLGAIFKHNPNYLFNYIHLGYQSYLLKESKLNMLDTLGFEAYRLGEFRGNITETEPIIRDADLRHSRVFIVPIL